MTHIYTTAPDDYDSFGSKTADQCAGTLQNGKQIRKVVAHEDYGIWQARRYQSGNYLALSQKEFDEWIREGLIQ